ncbi:SCO2522 family protein [Actinoplanes sp. NPDC049599]|uniref:SCO2522 family protein n=1 Tax=Actinoplanes sp. NPDC049599 TaxID=3363903 RepID=UPI0037AE1818
MTAYDGVFTEESATPVVRKVALSHLSVELGHLYMDDFQAGRPRLLAQFEAVRPWVAAAVRACAGELGERPPRVSTCFLIDDYFTRFSTPRAVIADLVAAAAEAGLTIDYVARESGCAVADGVDVATLVRQHLVAEPPEGDNGGRPPTAVSGWLSNGERGGEGPASAMAAPRAWQPPRQSAVQNHSIFVDIELWNGPAEQPRWSCPFLAAVWQLQRLGLIRHLGEPVGEPRPMTPREAPEEWERLPAVVQLNPHAAPFRAYRTFSALAARFLPIELAVRTILGQVAVDPAVAAQVRERAGAEGITLPGEVVDRLRYAFQ